MEFNAEFVTILAAVAGSVLWMTRQINGLEGRMTKKLNRIEKEIVAIKTIMFAHGMHIPPAVVNSEEGDE